MGNPKHIRWLQDGVETWNKRRQGERFTPDLENEDISSMFGVPHRPLVLRPPHPVLRGINLSGAKLNGAILENLDFSGSNFTGAQLNDARLNGSKFAGMGFWGTHFCRAKMRRCNLSGANFQRAWLESAELFDADLTGAEFLSCQLKGADFFRATLSGADFPLSRPWEAYLFGRGDDAEHADKSFQSEEIKSVTGLLEECRNLRLKHGDAEVLYFRGEGRWGPDWKLSPSVLRDPQESSDVELRSVEHQLLIDLITEQPEAFDGLRSALSEWVLAQHHRLPTRFLDVTRNPLVALFNACRQKKYRCEDGLIHVFAVPKSLIKSFDSDTVSVIANFAKLSRKEKNLLLGKVEADVSQGELPRLAGVEGSELLNRAKIRLYDGIRQEKSYFEERIDIRDLFKVFVVEPQRMFERIRAQSGAFLISAFHEQFEAAEILHKTKHVPIYSHFSVKVPEWCKETMIKDLRLLNVSKETMFPSIDESAKEIAKRHRGRDMSNRSLPGLS